MKKFIFTIIALLGTLIPTSALAQEGAYNEAYGVLVQTYSDDGSTLVDSYLTMYYDNKKKEHTEGIALGLDEMLQDPNMMQARRTLHSVIFDQSFAACDTIKSTKGWFAYCMELKTISGLEYLNTSEVTDMDIMFMECSALESLDLSHFNTSKVTTMSNMFFFCENLKTLDLSSFNTENVTDMSYMFGNCMGLTTIYVGSYWSTASVTESDGMFSGCSSLVGGAGTTFSEDHTDKAYAHIDRADQPGYLTYGQSGGKGEAEPYAVLSEDKSTLTFYYDEQKEARGGMSVGPFSGMPGDPSFQTWYLKGNINTVVFDDSFANCKSLTSTAYWFFDLSSLTTITGIDKLKTDNVTDMSGMFYGCENLTTLDLSGFNTEKVTDMHDMFVFCSSLTSLDLSGFKTDNVTSMTSMFSGCERLTSLNLSNFSNTKTTSMQLMFENCYSLTDLNLSGFRTDNVTDMHLMFYNCSSLVNLDLSSFNTENVTDMDNMFQVCSSLTSLDLSGFKTDNVTSMISMFGACYDLTTIYASDKWSVTNVTSGDYMFAGCTKLAGGAGTKYDENYSDYTYARIDGGPDNPGYFTDIADKGKEKMEQVATPTWAFQNELLALSTETADASIYYATANWADEAETDSIANTIDVSTRSTLYQAPLEITDNIIIKMIAAKEGMEDSEVATFVYDYKSWKELYDVIRYGVDVLEKAKDNVNVEEGLLEELRWALNEGDMMYQRRAEMSNQEAKYFTDAIVNLCKKIEDQMESGEQGGRASFYENVLTVEGDVSFTEALEKVGGLAIVNKSIAAIVWNSTKALTADSLQLIDNPNLLIYVQADSLAPEGTKNLIIDGKAKSITLVDTDSINNNFYAPQEFTAESISYTREFKQTTQKDVSRGWEGICLPFTVQAYTHDDHGTIAPFRNDASEFHFWLHQMTEDGMAIATDIEANKPYIISMPNNITYPATYNQAGKVTFSAKDVVVPVSTPVMIHLSDGSIGVGGVYNSLPKMEGFYALNVGDDFDGYPEGSVFVNNYRTIRPFEVYSYHAGRSAGTRSIISVASLFTGGVDGATGILDATDKQDSDEVKVFSVNGILLKKGNRNEVMNSLPKGLYIIGNQKIMVK